MNIKYVPQKSEKFSFTGLLLGCAASILIFLLLSWFIDLPENFLISISEDFEVVPDEPEDYSVFNLIAIVSSLIIYTLTCVLIQLVDYEILKKFNKFCNRKFLITYISSTILLGFYTKWVYTSFFIHKNKDDSALFLNFILDPVLVIKDTITTSSFDDLFLGLILIILIIGTKYSSITDFKENDVFCNNCNKWPETIEFRLYAKDFDWLSKKFNDDVNCLLSLPVIDVSSIEETDHSDRKIDPPIELITSSEHIKAKIFHCSTCNSLNTISIYSITYSDGKHRYSMSSTKVNETYILTKNQFDAFQLKKNETKTDFCEILEKSMHS